MIREYYDKWFAATNDRQKLQTIFGILAVAGVVIAGLFSLVNRELGYQILNVAYVAAVVWLVNFVTWALFLALTTKEPRQPHKATKR